MDKPGMSPQAGMDMMKKMMGGGEGGGPMQMCKDMTSAIRKTASLAAFATPELHALFSEWLEGREKEVLDTIAKPGRHDLAGIAKVMKLTPESTAYLLVRLAAKEKLCLEVTSTSPGNNASRKKRVKRSARKITKKTSASSEKGSKKAG